MVAMDFMGCSSIYSVQRVNAAFTATFRDINPMFSMSLKLRSRMDPIARVKTQANFITTLTQPSWRSRNFL